MSLGKISFIKLGAGGYDDAMFGLTVGLNTKDGSCQDFIGTWSYRSSLAEWTVESQEECFKKVILKIKSLMEDAKVNDFTELLGKPVDVTWNGQQLVSWRILKEVL